MLENLVIYLSNDILFLLITLFNELDNFYIFLLKFILYLLFSCILNN